MKRILIIYGGWEGHEPGACAALFQDQLTRRGYAVELLNRLDVLAHHETLKRFAVIVPMWTMGSLTEEQSKGLVAAVRSGVGLAGFHGGMGDAFRGNIEYQWMVGGQFLAHPDNFKTYRVDILKPQDAIVAGIASFSVTTEQYYMLVDPANEVLASTICGESTAAPWTKGVVMPVIWKKTFGAGRIFFSALGHSAKEFSLVPAQLEITLRGIAWAAGD